MTYEELGVAVEVVFVYATAVASFSFIDKGHIYVHRLHSQTVVTYFLVQTPMLYDLKARIHTDYEKNMMALCRQTS